MNKITFHFMVAATLIATALTLLVSSGGKLDAQDQTQNRPREDEQLKLGVDAYVYGFPLVLMDVTRRVQTAVSQAGPRKAPVNQFVHVPAFPNPAFTAVVSPNADTLYSSAWLDLTREPIVLSVPEMGKRYYLMQLLDAWTNAFAVPGTRTTGNQKGNFAVVGPAWQGKLPEGLREFKSPTNRVWLIGRTQTNGKADYAAVHAIQKQYKLTPLSAWGKAYAPPDTVPVAADVDLTTRPVEQVFRMDAATFFARLNALMRDNPPADADANAIMRFAAIGIAPGKAFDLKKLDQDVVSMLERSVRLAPARIVAQARQPRGKNANGWRKLPDNTADFGTDYDARAVVALIGLGANLVADAVYMRATVDADGQPLDGRNRYQIRFEKRQLPPVNAFWSITLYNAKQAFVANPINRYAIGDRDNLPLGDDGALTLFVQHDSPDGDKAVTWLPAPQGAFNLMLRLYWPKQQILDGVWKAPAIQRLAD